MKPSKKKDPFICSCNGVHQSKIEEAMKSGCKSLANIGDVTTAGVGACGGTCKPIIKKMLNHYEETGQFLPNPKKN